MNGQDNPVNFDEQNPNGVISQDAAADGFDTAECDTQADVVASSEADLDADNAAPKEKLPSGKDAIVKKILDEAALSAAATVAEAEEKADEMVASAAAECRAYIDKSNAEARMLTADTSKRRKTVAELDVKKLMLGKKTEIIDGAFSDATKKLEKLPTEKYLKLIEGMLSYAEDGDVVTISKQDEKLITEKFLADYAKNKGIKLTLSKTFGSFSKGMILSGHGIDKNLTFDVELKLLRDEIEPEVAKMIFSDK